MFNTLKNIFRSVPPGFSLAAAFGRGLFAMIFLFFLDSDRGGEMCDLFLIFFVLSPSPNARETVTRAYARGTILNFTRYFYEALRRGGSVIITRAGGDCKCYDKRKFS